MEFQIMKNPSTSTAKLAALRQFDRQQAQKLRRPKTDKEEARELIRRLEELIGQEATVVSGLEDEGTKAEEEKSEPQKSEVGDQKSETK